MREDAAKMGKGVSPEGVVDDGVGCVGCGCGEAANFLRMCKSQSFLNKVSH